MWSKIVCFVAMICEIQYQGILVKKHSDDFVYYGIIIQSGIVITCHIQCLGFGELGSLIVAGMEEIATFWESLDGIYMLSD